MASTARRGPFDDLVSRRDHVLNLSLIVLRSIRTTSSLPPEGRHEAMGVLRGGGEACGPCSSGDEKRRSGVDGRQPGSPQRKSGPPSREGRCKCPKREPPGESRGGLIAYSSFILKSTPNIRGGVNEGFSYSLKSAARKVPVTLDCVSASRRLRTQKVSENVSLGEY